MFGPVSYHHQQHGVPSLAPTAVKVHQWHRRADGAGAADGDGDGVNLERGRCLGDEDRLLGAEPDRGKFCEYTVDCLERVWFPDGLAEHRAHCARVAHGDLATDRAKEAMYEGCAAKQVDHIECYFNWLTTGGFNYTRTDIPGYMMHIYSDTLCRERVPSAEYTGCLARATGSTVAHVELVNQCQFVTCSDQTPDLFEVCRTNCFKPLVDNVIRKQAKTIEAKLSAQNCSTPSRPDNQTTTAPTKSSGATQGAHHHHHHPTATLVRFGLMLLVTLAHHGISH